MSLRLIPDCYCSLQLHCRCPLNAFRLFFDDFILKHIQKCTETEARCQKKNWSITLAELEAFIATVLARGVYGARTLELDSLWSKTSAPFIFCETMSLQRFRGILHYLRFDNKSIRSERLKTNKFALVSKVWKKFISNCQSSYVSGKNITVDEQLMPFKVRCRFTQYMANKLDKFDFKFWPAVESSSKYFLNRLPYLGEEESRPNHHSLPEYVVLKLIESYSQKERNVTADNFYTRLSLAEELAKRNTTLVGTMKRA